MTKTTHAHSYPLPTFKVYTAYIEAFTQLSYVHRKLSVFPYTLTKPGTTLVSEGPQQTYLGAMNR